MEYRIDYTILRRKPGEDDFTEIGFGSSGDWSTPDQAAHILESDIQHGNWETTKNMPDPEEIRREQETGS